MIEKRKDSKKRVLKEGEYQRANGTYEYRWRAANGRRSSVYAKTLEELREKEQDIFRASAATRSGIPAQQGSVSPAST